MENKSKTGKLNIYDFINNGKYGRSFPEIQIEYGSGDGYIYKPDINCYLWQGLKQKISCEIIELISDRKIIVHPVSVFIWLTDEMRLGLPVAKRMPEGGFKEPHWMPAHLFTIEHPPQYLKGEKEWLIECGYNL